MSKPSKVSTWFLYVQCFAAGVEVSAEYREAILALLMGYAGHTDLPPNEAGDTAIRGPWVHWNYSQEPFYLMVM